MEICCWWIKYFNPQQGFQSIWKALLDKYDSKIAYFTSSHSFSFRDIEQNANIYRQKFLGQKIVRINGNDVGIDSRHEERVVENRHTAIDLASAAETSRIRFVVVLPENATCRRVHREYVVGGLRDIHHTIDDERSMVEGVLRVMGVEHAHAHAACDTDLPVVPELTVDFSFGLDD